MYLTAQGDHKEQVLSAQNYLGTTPIYPSPTRSKCANNSLRWVKIGSPFFYFFAGFGKCNVFPIQIERDGYFNPNILNMLKTEALRSTKISCVRYLVLSSVGHWSWMICTKGLHLHVTQATAGGRGRSDALNIMSLHIICSVIRSWSGDSGHAGVHQPFSPDFCIDQTEQSQHCHYALHPHIRKNLYLN